MSDTMDFVAHDATPAAPSLSTLFFDTSAQIDAFAKAFPKAQEAMGDVLKKATNPAFKSKYADLSAVVEAVIPPLNSNGFSVLQPSGFVNGTVNVMTVFLHESGQWMRCTLALNPTKLDPQGIGSAITYGRRYGLQAMSGVAPEDDDGNAASMGQRSAREEIRNEAPSKPKEHAAFKAATNTINAAKTNEELDAWEERNAEIMGRMKGDIPEVHDAILVHLRNHRSALKSISETFGDTNEAASKLGGGK